MYMNLCCVDATRLLKAFTLLIMLRTPPSNFMFTSDLLTGWYSTLPFSYNVNLIIDMSSMRRNTTKLHTIA